MAFDPHRFQLQEEKDLFEARPNIALRKLKSSTWTPISFEGKIF
jgi:hypothetical protein